MTDRIGICVGCGTRFKVPPSFQGRSANCRKCGKAVRIESSAASSGAASAAPARSVRPAAEPAARPTSHAEDSSVASTLAFILGCAAILGGGGYYAWTTLRSAGSFEEEEASLPKSPANPATRTPETRTLDSTAAIESKEEGAAAIGVGATNPTPSAATTSETQPLVPVPEFPTLISFDPLQRPTDCAESTWKGFERTVREVFRASDASESARRTARAAWTEHRVAALCALLNGLDGLDLRAPMDAAITRRLLAEVAATSFDLIRIPPRPATEDALADARYEAKLVTQLIRFWSERMRAPERLVEDLTAAETRSKQRDF